MAEERIVVSINNKAFVVIDAEAAFGGDFPEESRILLIQGTADDIATLMMMDELFPLIVSTGSVVTQQLIAERKRGLFALGVENVEAEVNASVERLKAEGLEALAKRALPFMI